MISFFPFRDEKIKPIKVQDIKFSKGQVLAALDSYIKESNSGVSEPGLNLE